MFTPKLVWTLCQNTLAQQARKGLYLLKKYSFACNGLPLTLQFELFDKMISPILLYGSEIWGYKEAEKIERVLTDYCKQVLGVPSHTSNMAVLMETGRLPLYLSYYKKLIKYWLKLLNMPNTRYPKACYKLLHSLDQQGRTTWATTVKELLYKYGFRDVWESHEVGNENLFLKELHDRILQQYIVQSQYNMSQSTKLSLLRMLNVDCVTISPYLNILDIKPYRAGLAKLRCSSHNLQIEKARHKNQLMAERICELCHKTYNSYILEDEYHFVMHCPSYQELRVKYLGTEITDQSYNGFLTLLNKEDANTVKKLASFIYQAYKQRQLLLKSSAV